MTQPASSSIIYSPVTNSTTSPAPAPVPSPSEKLPPQPNTTPVRSSGSPASIGITLGGLKNVKDAARDKILADSNRNAAIEITDSKLHDGWIEVVEIIAGDKMLYKSAILESILTHVLHEITIHANVVAFDFLKGERLRLLDFFKRYFNNEKINVLFAPKKIEVDNKGEQVMSTREIFEMMADKNPNLRILKDKLGMDMEY